MNVSMPEPSQREIADPSHKGGKPIPSAANSWPEDVRRIDAILSILDATKANKAWFDDRGLRAGYHSISVGGEKVPGQRDPEKRIAKMPYDFSGKRVLDIGCSNGGLLHELSDRITFGVGVDFNTKCINAANAIKAANGTANVHFYTFDLDKDDLPLLDSFTFGTKVDVCLILNIALWVKKWKDVVLHCADLCDTLIFEAHGTAEQQALQVEFMRSVYAAVTLLTEQSDDDPTYSKRSMFLCESRRATQDCPVVSGSLNMLDPRGEGDIRRAYETCFAGSAVHEVRVFSGTHESTVAEINGDYIVKFPQPHRGTKGIDVEKRITDLIRARVQVPVPSLSVHAEPVLMARYRKISGRGFNRSTYQRLSDKDKTGLSEQLAAFMHGLHAVSQADVQAAGITFAPSWALDADLMDAELSSSEHHAIKKVLAEVLRNHRQLQIPAADLVFGHFDLHDGNFLLDDEHARLAGVIDFGNCKFGDVHQDFAPLFLTSYDLAERVIRSYEKVSGRQINRLLVQHYVTAFHLQTLASLNRDGYTKKVSHWLEQLDTWYGYLLNDRAAARVAALKPPSLLPDSWREWVATNMMHGCEPASLLRTLRGNGFSDLEAAAELAFAAQDPYVFAGRKIFQTLKKRDWLLKTCDALASLDERYSKRVQTRAAPDFDTFALEYYSKHLPVLLTGGVDHWPARKKWSPDYFAEQFGDVEVEVQSGRESDPMYERNSGKHKRHMTMREFVRKVQATGNSNDFYMTANNMKTSMPGLKGLFDDVGDFASGYRTEGGGAHFLWFGPKGTFTPLHHDLTNNMLVQLTGRKKVTLIPAFETPLLYNDVGVFSAAEFPNFDEHRHPLLKDARPVEVEIGPGEALFIPIGWWHCVESLDTSISVSFTDFRQINSFFADYPR